MQLEDNHPLRLQRLNIIYSKTLMLSYAFIACLMMSIIVLTLYMLLADNFIQTYLMDGVSTCLVT
jgi:hypothetical protein